MIHWCPNLKCSDFKYDFYQYQLIVIEEPETLYTFRKNENLGVKIQNNQRCTVSDS